MTIKVCYDQEYLLNENECAVPIKASGVTIGYIGIRHNGRVEFLLEAQPSAFGVSDTTRECCIDVSDSMVRGFAAKLASAFGIAEDEIEIEHEETIDD